MQNLMNSIVGTEMTFETYCYCMLAALFCGIIAAFSASYKSNVSKSFMISLVLLPIIVATVIIMVNGSVGTGVAVMGAFSLVRFRSVPGKAKDISSIFLAMTAGLACATGYVGIAVLLSVVVCLVTVVMMYIPLKDDRVLDLRITIPESLNYSNAFEDIFNEFTRSHKLVKVKTGNMGSLYNLFYRIEIKDA